MFLHHSSSVDHWVDMLIALSPAISLRLCKVPLQCICDYVTLIHIFNKKSQSNLRTAASSPFTAENGLAHCMFRAQCPLQTSLITQPLVCHIHTTQPHSPTKFTPSRWVSPPIRKKIILRPTPPTTPNGIIGIHPLNCYYLCTINWSELLYSHIGPQILQSLNTSIPNLNALPTSLTIPNGSSIASCIFTQLHNKVPIGYKGTHHIHPQNCRLLWGNHQSQLYSSSLDQVDPTTQMASRSNQPLFHNTSNSRQMDQWTDWQMGHAKLSVPTPNYALYDDVMHLITCPQRHLRKAHRSSTDKKNNKLLVSHSPSKLTLKSRSWAA